jgi:hypothetical protein
MTRIVLRAETPAANEALCLAVGYERTTDPWFVQEFKALCREIDEDLDARPLDNHAGLRKLVEEDASFIRDDTEQAVNEIGKLWTEIGFVTVDVILHLATGVRLGKLLVEYRTLRAFIAEGCYRESQITDPAIRVAN